MSAGVCCFVSHGVVRCGCSGNRFEALSGKECTVSRRAFPVAAHEDPKSRFGKHSTSCAMTDIIIMNRTLVAKRSSDAVTATQQRQTVTQRHPLGSFEAPDVTRALAQCFLIAFPDVVILKI